MSTHADAGGDNAASFLIQTFSYLNLACHAQRFDHS
ncbi:hypothetical protein KPSA1_04486 [Pseudomonas syringae pv. actinidiae]|uniref:Uncharacterized protein n=1 Tax=Pseudomonas syringae pv. actinidiae TaxID=103796 RepID=A0A2V0QLC2_PSESF|nr:hypothetical protein KPSA1_04486 [Pseudomonas syringae pv. actinidiae]